ncbi:MAG: ribosome small subunit-dependent GTPase A [Woeseiaceae bacterium]|nr:ribosome small subunit-dependent GTPase A [Woeseiaceae bacterium]
MPEANATVIATYSRRMRLRLPDDSEVDARIKGKKLKPVCGDRVAAEELADEADRLITAIAPRDNELTRPNLRGEPEVLAANVDLLVVVAAALPAPDWFVVDRYLAAAEIMRADAMVVYNKADIEAPDTATLSVYEKLGYPSLVTSAETGQGIDELRHRLADRIAIVVGQSGVGKSSIINELMGSELQKTAEISTKHREGRHTTVNSVMIPLDAGGNVIDSPGVRDYAPALESSAAAAAGFREILAASEHCRFANCRHMQEPGCAVKAGVEDGSIDARRYESYRRIVITTEKLAEGRY